MPFDRSLLHKATNGDDPNPTPGYLYGEIANMANESAVDAEKVAKYIADRLGKSNPFTKIKCLVVTKQVCRKSASFRRAMHHRHVAKVKEHLQYRGPRHELLGDKLNQGVRDNAREAVEAIFDTSPVTSDSNGAFASRITGFGSVQHPSEESAQQPVESDGTLAGTTAAIQSAILNSQGAKYLSNRIFGAEEASPVVGGGTYQSPGTAGGFGGSGSKYGGIGNPNFVDPRNKPKGLLDRVKEKIEHKMGDHQESGPAAVPGWMAAGSSGAAPGVGTAGSGYQPRQSGQVGGGWDAAQVTLGGGGNTGRYESNGAARTGGAKADGSYERSHVEGLCTPGGVRAVPPADKLRGFLGACRTFDPEVVMPILEEKVGSRDWKVQHKALCVYEALVKDPSLERFADYIDDHSEALEELRDCKQTSVRDRSRRVWALLYGEEPEEPKPQPVTVPASEPNLLDFGEPSPPGDLLGFGKANGAVEGGKAQAAPAPSGVQPSADLLALGAGNGSTEAVPATSSVHPPAQPAGVTSMFSNMTVKTKAVASDSTIPNTTAPEPKKSTAFGFINQAPVQSQKQNTAPSTNTQLTDLLSSFDAQPGTTTDPGNLLSSFDAQPGTTTDSGNLLSSFDAQPGTTTDSGNLLSSSSAQPGATANSGSFLDSQDVVQGDLLATLTAQAPTSSVTPQEKLEKLKSLMTQAKSQQQPPTMYPFGLSQGGMPNQQTFAPQMNTQPQNHFPQMSRNFSASMSQHMPHGMTPQAALGMNQTTKNVAKISSAKTDDSFNFVQDALAKATS